jgi:hypothetical protein
VLAHGGMLPVYQPGEAIGGPSPRKRGVKQGGILLLTGAILVPILGVLDANVASRFLDILVGVAAILCFVGGPLRMLYAALFEEGAPRPQFVSTPYAAPTMPTPQSLPPRNVSVLPPASATTTSPWRRRNTGELVNQPSVTENTTRLLDEEERKNRSS